LGGGGGGGVEKLYGTMKKSNSSLPLHPPSGH